MYRAKFTAVFFILSFLVYLSVLRGINGNPAIGMIKNNLDSATKPFELSPERGRFILTYSLAQNRSFALDKNMAEAAYPDVGYYKGRFYVFFTPGVSILAVPFYLIGAKFQLSQVFTFTISLVFALGNMICLLYISYKIFSLSFWKSTLSPLIFAFASTSLSYANTLYQHHISTFLILSGFIAVWHFRKKLKYSYLWAFYVWFIYGASIFIDYPNVLLLMPVMVYFFLSSFEIRKEAIKITVNFRLGFVFTSFILILLVLIHGFYNRIHFGSFSATSGGILGYKAIRENNLRLGNPADEKIIEELAGSKKETGFFKEENLPSGFYTLFFSSDRGLFLYSPIYLLAVLGIVSIMGTINTEFFILLLTIAVNIFLYGSWGDPWGGWAFGPRYLIPSLSLLSIFVVKWIEKSGKNLVDLSIFILLFIFSSVVSLLGALTTNQVPPKTEAEFLGTKYNFLLNFDYFKDGRSSSFLYNNYLSNYMSLGVYSLIILLIILSLLVFIMYEDYTD